MFVYRRKPRDRFRISFKLLVSFYVLYICFLYLYCFHHNVSASLPIVFDIPRARTTAGYTCTLVHLRPCVVSFTISALHTNLIITRRYPLMSASEVDKFYNRIKTCEGKKVQFVDYNGVHGLFLPSEQK